MPALLAGAGLACLLGLAEPAAEATQTTSSQGTGP
jgi:hypothetical protein